MGSSGVSKGGVKSLEGGLGVEMGPAAGRGATRFAAAAKGTAG